MYGFQNMKYWTLNGLNGTAHIYAMLWKQMHVLNHSYSYWTNQNTLAPNMQMVKLQFHMFSSEWAVRKINSSPNLISPYFINV